MSFRRRSLLAPLVLALAAGCQGGGSGAAPSPTVSPTASPTPAPDEGPEGRPGASSPSIAFDRAGALHAIWVEGGAIATASRDASGWSTTTVLDPGTHGSAPAIAAAADGLVAVWSAGADGVFAARLAGSAWSAPVRISPAELGPAGRPALAVDGSGRALALWGQRSASGLVSGVYAAGEDPGGWSAADALDALAPAVDDPRLAIDGSGEALAAWRAWDGMRVSVRAAARSAGHWSQASRLDGGSAECHFLAAAMGPAGGLVAWSQGGAIRAARRAGGAWSAPVMVSGSSSAVSPAIAQGDTVVWQELDAGATQIVSRRFDGASWTAPATLSGPGALAPRAAGPAIAWRDTGGGFWLLAGSGPERIGGAEMVTELSLAQQGSSVAAAWRDREGLHVVVR